LSSVQPQSPPSRYTCVHARSIENIYMHEESIHVKLGDKVCMQIWRYEDQHLLLGVHVHHSILLVEAKEVCVSKGCAGVNNVLHVVPSSFMYQMPVTKCK
jgi:hypothetical protein